MSDSLRLLFVQHADAEVVPAADELQRAGYACRWRNTRTPDEMREALADGPWDVILADCQLRWPAGGSPLDVYRQNGLDAPFIVLSTDVGEEAAVALMRSGAHDVVSRDRIGRLPQAVRLGLREAHARIERRRSEQLLRQSEERYRKLFEESNDAIFVIEKRTGRYLDANRAAERLTGRSVSELRRLTTRDVAPAGAADRLRALSERPDAHVFGEVEYVQPDGRTRVGLLGVVHINDDIAYGIAHDITDRKRVENVLRALLDGTTAVGEPFFHALVRELASAIGASDVAVARVMPGGDRVRCVAVWSENRHGENLEYVLHGTPSEGVVGRQMCYYPTEVAALFPDDEELARRGMTTYLGVPLMAADGAASGILFALGRQPFHDAALARSVMRIFAARAEAEFERIKVADALRRLAAAIEHSEEGVVITDTGGVIEYVNPAFERITGYTGGEVIGQHTRILKSGRQDASFYQHLWKTITAGRTWTGRFVNRRKDGTTYTEDCSISPVFGPGGHVERFVAAKRDVTRSLRLEEDLRQAQRVESVGRLAAGVAHDFNNLLSPILGYSELLLQDLHPADERHAQIREIEEAAKRARDLTRQLLAFGRKQTLQIKPVDLSAVVSGLERLIRRTLREDVELRILPDTDACVVLADTGQAEQVLMNLVVNAQDAMPGGGSLTIRVEKVHLGEADGEARPGAVPGAYGTLVVTDTGTGMDEQTVQQIFEPFFSTKGERGTGLGLSTVYGIVKQHGGHVWVDSEVGHGTTFRVFLPTTAAVPAPVEEPTPSAGRGGGTGTILLVEDNDAVRHFAQTVLQREGYRVLSAPGGREALALLDADPGPVHLLLTDVIMSGMDGRELFRQVAERHPGLRVIFMSGYTDDIVADRGVVDGSVHFVQKPFAVAALTQKVRDVIGAGR